MKLNLVKLCLSAALIGSPVCTYSQIEHSAYVPAGYKLVYSEEFDNASNKEENWLHHMENGVDRDWDYFCVDGDGYARLKDVTIVTDASTNSTRVTKPSALTKKMWKYGYFECRYKYSKSNGINNSFWMIANGSPLDMQTLEIDINEGQLDEGGKRQFGEVKAELDRQDAVRPLVLEWSKNGNPSEPAYWYSGSLFNDPDYDLSENYVTIGFEWTPNKMRFYCDGKLMLETDNIVKGENCPNKGNRWLNYPMPIYLSSLFSSTINHAEDRNSDGEMVVDYVRVYQNADSEGIGEAPVEGDNLLKNGEFGSTETNDYAVSHYTGNKQTMYSWVASMGSVKNGYYECSPSAARTSPLYMPAQFINHLPDGKYELSFKAKITCEAGGASLHVKISDNKDLSTSNIGNNTTYGIPQASCQDWTEFKYVFDLKGGAEDITEDRLMFILNNPNGPATFAIDDVVLVPYTEDNEYINDSGFDKGLSGGVWSGSSNYEDIMTRTVETEGENKYIRTVINRDNDIHGIYQTNISQRTTKIIEDGLYRISLRARAATAETVGKKFALQMDNAAAPYYYKEIVSTDNGLYLAYSYDTTIKFMIFTIDSEEWKTYSAIVKLSPGDLESTTARAYFRFHQAGTFDIDDVSVRKLDVSEILTPDNEGIYQITSENELRTLADMVNAGENFYGKTVKLANSISIGSSDWTPIGYYSKHSPCFAGTFDGQGYSVTDMKMTAIGQGCGLFGNVSGTVCNLSLSGEISTGNTANKVGSLVGILHGGGTISNVASSVNITNKGQNISCLGGIVGCARLDNGEPEPVTIEKSTYSGNIATDMAYNGVGGITGYLHNGKIDNSIFTGNISGIQANDQSSCAIGGIAGCVDNESSEIINSISCGTVGNGGTFAGMVNACKNISNSYCPENAMEIAVNATSLSPTTKSSEAFNNGEVAYLLQSGNSEMTWGQTIGTDTYPTLTSDETKRVYTYNIYNGKAEAETAYANNGTDINLPESTNAVAIVEGFNANGNNIITKTDNGSYACESLVLTDGADFYTPVSFTATKATYSRTLPSTSTWGTIILPFAAATIEGANIYEAAEVVADGSNESILSVVPVESMAANTPTLLHGNNAGAEVRFSADNVEVAKTDGNVLTKPIGTSGYTLTGSLSEINKLDEGDFFISKDKFWSVGTQNTVGMKAFRAYIDSPTTQAVNAMRIMVGNTTNINKADDNGPGTINVYNIQGTMLRKGAETDKALDGLPSGIYVVGGKKKIKK